jgi:hypothetical protein
MKMEKLIVNPEEAKQQLELDEACTKRDVITYVKNYHKGALNPQFLQLANQIVALQNQQQMGGVVVNNLIDFLEQEGFRTDKNGRVYLNPQDWQAFCKKQYDKAQELRAKASN